MVEIFPPSNFHLQHLDLLQVCVNMQTFNLNIDSQSVSATTDGLQKPADVVQFNSSRKGSTTISHLPTEILSEIFLYCLPEDEHLWPASSLAPMLLTTICRRWREVAVGLPMLWCRLYLRFDSHWEQKRVFCYEPWLKRSKGCPLSLRLETRTNWKELRSLLQPYIQKISSLLLIFLPGNEPFTMENFHTLKELTMQSFHGTVYPMHEEVDRSLLKLPVNLRRVNMMTLSYFPENLDLFANSAWAGLTHIEIGVLGLDSFLRVLRICPNLSSLVLNGIFDPIELPESITHSNLQSLCLYGDWTWYIDGELGLFKDVTLPNLRVIEAHRMGAWPHEEFMEFLRRSNYPLESLIFGGEVFSAAWQRAEYATLMPSLELVADPEFDVDIVEDS